jgi:ammonium transporter Rh
MIFFGLNWSICMKMGLLDVGGSVIIHSFGAFYGIAASFFFQPDRSAKSENFRSSYNSEITAALGSLFLFVYWPSLTGALQSGVD